ncbi:MAG: GDP-mannose 4,6-dehydratase, partial [Gemmataceae bacterium]
FQAIESSGLKPRILHVGTGLVYAPPEGEALLDECASLGPASPYAASKLAGDFLARREGQRLGLEVVVARPLNHIGPRQDPQFALASFARQIARMEKGLQPPVLETGNLTPARDLSDVRESVEGYWLLLRDGIPGEVYNLGSGQALRMGDVLDHLLRHARVKVELVTRGDLLRPGEPEVFRADTGKLRRDTGWSPRHSLDETLSDLLEWCRETV